MSSAAIYTDVSCHALKCFCTSRQSNLEPPRPDTTCLPRLIRPPCAGLDLENDPAAANTRALPNQSPNDSTACMAKPSLPHVRHSTLATTQHQTNHTHQSARLPSQQQQQQQQVVGILKEAGAGCRATQHGAAPTSWVPPAQMILPRAGVFYCGSFSASCGLPKHSELHLIKYACYSEITASPGRTAPGPSSQPLTYLGLMLDPADETPCNI